MITALRGFNDIQFPRGGIIYVLYFLRDNRRIYFYVGESGRNVGRIGDYISGQFSAPTDFKVGEAVKYLESKNLQVRIMYREDRRYVSRTSRKIDEGQIKAVLLKAGFKLLNDLPGYKYREADETVEKTKIHTFMATIV